MNAFLDWTANIGNVSVAGSADEVSLQRVFGLCGDFYTLLHGHPLKGSEAAELLAELPPGVHQQDKVLSLVLDLRGVPLGLLSAYRHYPGPDEWFLGDLVLAPAERNRGLGGQIFDAFEGWVRHQRGSAIHLIVQEVNPAALRFWTGRGFREVAQTRQTVGSREHLVFRLRRDL